MSDNLPLYGFLILTLIIFMTAIFTPDTSTYKYKVTAPGFGYRYINHYTIDNNKCLQFVKNDKNYTFCGSYEIIKLK